MASRMQVATYVADHLAEERGNAIEAAAAWLVDAGRGRDARYLARDIAAVLEGRGHVLAHVTTARPMNAEALAAVESFIKDATKATELELVTEVNARLIGGLKIELPTATLDASVQAKLDKFVEEMKGVTL